EDCVTIRAVKFVYWHRLSSLTAYCSLPSQSPFPRLSPQGILAMLPYLILRRLSSPSQSHAAPCITWRRGTPAGALSRMQKWAFAYLSTCRLFADYYRIGSIRASLYQNETKMFCVSQ